MSDNYYSEIDEIPLYNWIKCIDGHFQYVSKDAKKYYSQHDVKAFLELFDKYLKYKGFTFEQESFIKMQQSCIAFAAKFLQTGESGYITHFLVAKAQLEKIDPRKTKSKSIPDILIILSKWIGYWIDSKKITLEDYLTMMAAFEAENTVKK